MRINSSAVPLRALAAAMLLAFSAGGFAGNAGKGGADVFLDALDDGNQYDRFIVKFRDGSAEHANAAALEQALQNASRGQGLALGHVRRLAIGADVIEASSKLNPRAAEALMRALASNPNVEYIEPDAIMQIAFTPNDTRYNEQWHYFEATGGLNLPAAWDKATGTGVTVAVLDTGSTNHTDLNANTVAGYDFITSTTSSRDGNGRDSNPQDEGDWAAAGECYAGSPASNSSWHGTHVAGTVAAVTNNAKGVAGVAYNAKVQHVRVLGKCGGSLSDIADAIVWASGGTVTGIPANATPAKVINMSLGGSGTCGTTYQTAIDSAVGRGTVVIVAAGNSNTDVVNARPANCNNVVAVASTNRNGGRAYYSNYGSLIDVAAPGGDTASGTSNGVLSTLNAGATTPGSESYAFYQGTSMATPHVAGVAALMQSVASPAKTPAEIESLLKSTTRSFPATCTGCGTGIVNALAAVDAVLGGSGNVLTNGVPKTGLAGSAGTELRYTMSVPANASGLTFAMSGGTGDADLYVKFGSAPTTTSYDCRPFLTGNNETCNISPAQVGTYHVMVRGYTSFSGISLTGSYNASSFFENTADYTIADHSTVESPITVSGRTGNAPSNLKVNVRIIHTYIGDLKVDLVSPSGLVYVLHNRTGGSADNIITTYTVNASGSPANGTWKLRVNDNATGDTGYIDSWSLQF